MEKLSYRWDLGDSEKLPSYLRVVFQSVVNTIEEIEQQMKPRGRSRLVQLVVDEVSPPKLG